VSYGNSSPLLRSSQDDKVKPWDLFFLQEVWPGIGPSDIVLGKNHKPSLCLLAPQRASFPLCL